MAGEMGTAGVDRCIKAKIHSVWMILKEFYFGKSGYSNQSLWIDRFGYYTVADRRIDIPLFTPRIFQ